MNKNIKNDIKCNHKIILLHGSKDFHRSPDPTPQQQQQTPKIPYFAYVKVQLVFFDVPTRMRNENAPTTQSSINDII